MLKSLTSEELSSPSSTYNSIVFRILSGNSDKHRGEDVSCVMPVLHVYVSIDIPARLSMLMGWSELQHGVSV